jgi:predicted nucleotidyltransferase
MPLNDERLSALSPRHKLAIAATVSYIEATFDPLGILVAGTIVRGEGHANSDLDFAVVHNKPWRQRIQRFEEGIPIEIFVNPPWQWRKTFDGEVQSGHPPMLGIFSSGVPVFEGDSTVSMLVNGARWLFEQGPQISEELLTGLRYALVTHFEDAVDIEQIDLERSNAFVVNSLLQAARLHVLQSGEWLPREKILLNRLEARDPDLGQSIRAVLDAPRGNWVRLATPIVEHVAGAARFFAWESAPQDVPL